jgi:hypothetical protein
VSVTLFTYLYYFQYKYTLDSSKGSPSKRGRFAKPTSAVGSSSKTTVAGVLGPEDDSAFPYFVTCLGLNFTIVQYRYWMRAKRNSNSLMMLRMLQKLFHTFLGLFLKTQWCLHVTPRPSMKRIANPTLLLIYNGLQFFVQLIDQRSPITLCF